MTAHDHATFVPGCYRCELGRDEVTPEPDPRLVTLLGEPGVVIRFPRRPRIVSTACTGFPRGVCGPGYPIIHDECLTPNCACSCHAVVDIEPPIGADQ